jgi:hypothetical protein
MLFIAGTHALAGLVVVLMPALEWWWKLLLLLPIGYSLWHFWGLHIWRNHPRSVTGATFYQLDSWLIRTPSGSRFAALDDSSFIQPWWCVLNLRSDAGRLHTLVLPPDSLPEDTLRQLRVRLRFGGNALPEKKQPSRRKGG